jgi:hypothetical protein
MVLPAVTFQSFADDQVEFSVSLRPFLFPQARLDDMAALARQPHGQLVDGGIGRTILANHGGSPMAVSGYCREPFQLHGMAVIAAPGLVVAPVLLLPWRLPLVFAGDFARPGMGRLIHGSRHHRPFQISASHICLSQIGPAKIRVRSLHSLHACTVEAGVLKICALQGCTPQIGVTQIGAGEIGPAQIAGSQVRPPD